MRLREQEEGLRAIKPSSMIRTIVRHRFTISRNDTTIRLIPGIPFRMSHLPNVAMYYNL